MIADIPRLDDLSAATQEFYRKAIMALDAAAVPFLAGGAYGLAHQTGIVRHTKDFDVFVRAADAQRALAALSAAGYATELTFAHWLGKAFCGEDFVDVIFSSGNGVARVDDDWFAYAKPVRFLGRKVLVCPPEETIWSKAFVAERERYDGADVNHLIRACGRELNWHRLMGRFGPHWRVLLNHLVLFGFVYPSERELIPSWVIVELAGRLKDEAEHDPPQRRLCGGTLLSRTQYVIDLEQWGFEDARLEPESGMTAEQIRAWTRAGFQE